jgi:molybdopterin-dependent oxidoreductase alpha subunit
MEGKERYNNQTDQEPLRRLRNLKLERPSGKSAGIPALISALKEVNQKMSLSAASKVLFNLNQKGGIDCPGCAWPDPDDDRSILGEYCENGVKAIAEEAMKKRIDASFFRQHSIVELSKMDDYDLGQLGRLAEPLYLAEGATHYTAISWSEAFRKVSKALNDLPSPDDAIFYTSGRTSNEAAFLYQLFVRAYGTNNLPDCSNMCHESSGKALSETLGIGKGSVTLPDLYEAELIIIMGQNPGTNHPRMLSALEKCKKNGGKIISVNPLKESGLINFIDPQSPLKVLTGGTDLTDIYLPIKINEDVALVKVWLRWLIDEEEANPGTVLDWNFINAHCEGYPTLKDHLKSLSISELIQRTGLKEPEIRAAFQLILDKKKIIICWAMGLTQHENAVDNIREVVNLLLLKGSIGKPGSGTCPVRGHSNVQGDRTMGIWEEPPMSFLDKQEEVFQIPMPRHHGYSVVDAIKAMFEQPGKVFFAMGGNFLSATPDTNYTAAALRNCTLTAHVSTKLNRSHLITGKEAIILPCLGRTEIDIQGGKPQFVTVENSMGIVHSSKGTLQPASNKLMSEPAIVASIAKYTLKHSVQIDWGYLIEDYGRIRDLIEAVIPGFGRFNERIKNPEGFYLPNGSRVGTFQTADEKAHFTVNHLSSIAPKEDELIMMTIRSHDQYNTTIYGLNDRYRGIYNERRIILMHPEDMKSRNIQLKDRVNLHSCYDGQERIAELFVVVPYDIPKGCCATYFPEANVLIPYNQYAKKSKTPISKSVIIKVKRVNKS